MGDIKENIETRNISAEWKTVKSGQASTKQWNFVQFNTTVVTVTEAQSDFKKNCFSFGCWLITGRGLGKQ